MMQTAQEAFWAGDFGTAYTERDARKWSSRAPFWRDILARTGATSILEAGCNAGVNMRAIRHVDPMLALWGCDVNETALAKAQAAGLSVIDSSLFTVGANFPGRFDLTFTCGVLIHIAPEDVERAMQAVIAASRRYVLAIEYASEAEEPIVYRGHEGFLWKRPFGRMYEALGLALVAEGEAPVDAFDRCHWWLLTK